MENNLENAQSENIDVNVSETVSEDNADSVTKKAVESKNPYEELFAPEELKLIEEYAGKVNITDENVLSGYGVTVQKKAVDIVSAAALGAAPKDDGVVIGLIEQLAKLIGDMESTESDKTGILGIFKTKSGKLAELSSKFELVEPVADEASLALDSNYETTCADVKIFGDIYEVCLNCIKELTMYIAAGKMKLTHERDVTLVKICEFAKNSGETADIDAASDFAEMCRRFGERITYLEQTRAYIMQVAPKVMLLRNNSSAMREMIGEINTNALSVWKRHAASALGIDNVGSAVKMPGNAFDREFLRTINTEMLDLLGSVVERYKAVGEDRARVEAELRAAECELKQLLRAAANLK